MPHCGCTPSSCRALRSRACAEQVAQYESCRPVGVDSLHARSRGTKERKETRGGRQVPSANAGRLSRPDGNPTPSFSPDAGVAREEKPRVFQPAVAGSAISRIKVGRSGGSPFLNSYPGRTAGRTPPAGSRPFAGRASPNPPSRCERALYKGLHSAKKRGMGCCERRESGKSGNARLSGSGVVDPTPIPAGASQKKGNYGSEGGLHETPDLNSSLSLPRGFGRPSGEARRPSR